MVTLFGLSLLLALTIGGMIGGAYADYRFERRWEQLRDMEYLWKDGDE